MPLDSQVKLPKEQIVTEALREIAAATAMPSISVDINIGGQRLSARTGRVAIDSEKPITAESAFRIACLIKFFGSLVCLHLAEEGRLDLDAPIGVYLPELNAGPNSKGQSILVRHLMAHTGGYRGLDISKNDVSLKWSWEDCVKFFKATPQFFTPGTVFNEGHFDHVILGQILHRITGRLTPQLVKERIFAPLGITAGNVDEDIANPERHVFGHKYSPAEKKLEKVSGGNRPLEAWLSSRSNLTLRVQDLRRIGEALIRMPGTAAVFSPLVLDGLRVPAIPIVRTTAPRGDVDWMPKGFSLSAGIFPKGRAGYLAVGRGQNCGVVTDHENKIVVAVALNASAPAVRAAVLDRVFSLIHGTLPGPILPKPPTYDGLLRTFRINQIIGRYAGSFPEDIIVAGDTRNVLITMGHYFQMSLKLVNDNRIVVESRSPVPITFFPEPGSGAPSIMLGMNAFKKVA
jgi:CubicO group peptidase (beta-lactamase class C family)